MLCRVFHKSRDIPNAKQGIASEGSNSYNTAYDYHHDATISSSSLPPLMDPYSIGFNQTHPNNSNTALLNDYYEQVPCFSIFSPNHPTTTTTTTPSSAFHHPAPTMFGALPADICAYFNSASSSSTDKTVIKAVLGHLNMNYNNNNTNNNVNNMVNVKGGGGGSPSFGEGSSESTSFLSEVGLNSIWNNNY